MKRTATRLFPLVLVLLGFATQARAWNKPGHMVIAALAYRELKQSDPQALARAVAILKTHPWYQTRWRAAVNSLNVNDPDKEGMYLFMLAARWPDDARETDFHCAECHYINYPYKPDGQPNSVIVQPYDSQTILCSFQRNVDIVNGGGRDSDKAVALAWIFHLVGDVHQPLHTVKLFTTRFPNGDRGGTRFYIRPEQGAPTTSLHTYWDDALQDADRYVSVRNRADELRARTDLERADLPELSERDFDQWARAESFTAAKVIAYRNGTLRGSANEADGAVLPDDYAASIRPTVERRAAAAGYRLSDLLRDWF